VPHYEVWRFHGESIEEEEEYYSTWVDRMDMMLETLQAFFKLLKALEELLHEHIEVTLLTFIT
jgi:hypothetical protein